jgi:adenosylcobinamide-GDP ribazoletransferase
MSARALGAALRFLTILPVPGRSSVEDLERAPVWFPFTGALVGSLAAAADLAGSRAGLPPAVRCVLTVAVLAALTGGLHLDGLADAADGLLSARPRDRALEIMRDSRIGTMGTLALVLVLALKAGGLLHLEGVPRLWAIVLAPTAGRAALVATLCVLPYARRQEGGLATVFVQRRHSAWVLWAGLPTVAVAAAAGAAAGSRAIASVILVTAALGVVTRRRLGGFTGDTLGATSEVAEAVVFVCASCG